MDRIDDEMSHDIAMHILYKTEKEKKKLNKENENQQNQVNYMYTQTLTIWTMYFVG